MSQFSWLDGGIVGLYLLAAMTAGIMVRKYVGRVEDFLVAGREIKLYLGIASLAATEFGIVTCMYTAQNGYQFGFAGATPGIIQFVVMLLVGYTGFCIKPLRDAEVLTIPELFQKRYGSGVRWASGVVIVLGGLLNMGVFLRVGGEFLVVVVGLAGEGGLVNASEGGFLAEHRLELMMTGLLLMVMIYTILGGMLSVLVTDFLQFVVMSAGLLVVTILILVKVGWSDMVAAVESHYGAGGFNPLANEKMGVPYLLFFICLQVAVVLTWQTSIQRVLGSKDTKTGQQMYTRTSFFFACRFLIPALWGIAALALLTPEQVGGNDLHAMPKMLSMIVPIGIMGVLVAAMLAADMSTNSAYMLTWGSVIYNDIMAPFRKGAWSDKRGLRWNRSIVAGIGIFLLFYGLWYPLPGNVWDYLAITGTIYLASMSTLLIACCYWSRANNWGAAGAIACGALIPLAYLILDVATRPPAGVVLEVPRLAERIGPYYSGIAAYVCAALAMVLGSYLKPLIVKETHA